MPVNSKLKTTKIIGQRKAFYRQRIPESSCARKETVNIDILVISRNGHRKIMQFIRTNRPPSRKRKWNQLSQFWRISVKVIPTIARTTSPPPSPLFLKEGGSKFWLPATNRGKSEKLKKGVEVWCRGKSS